MAKLAVTLSKELSKFQEGKLGVEFFFFFHKVHFSKTVLFKIYIFFPKVNTQFETEFSACLKSTEFTISSDGTDIMSLFLIVPHAWYLFLQPIQPTTVNS